MPAKQNSNCLDEADLELIAAARETLRLRYEPDRHTVAAAIRVASGKIHTGVNVYTCGYGPCAEAIALGTAFTAGDRYIQSVVAVRRRDGEYSVISPCGNCRQMLMNYAPEATVIYMGRDGVRKATVSELLPGAYLSFD